MCAIRKQAWLESRTIIVAFAAFLAVVGVWTPAQAVLIVRETAPTKARTAPTPPATPKPGRQPSAGTLPVKPRATASRSTPSSAEPKPAADPSQKQPFVADPPDSRSTEVSEPRPGMPTREASPARAPEGGLASPTNPFAEEPRYSAGDSWSFVRTVNSGDKTAIGQYTTSLATVNDQELVAVSGVRLTRSLAAMTTISLGNMRSIFRPHALSLKFPLFAGKTWDESYEQLEAEGAQRVLNRVQAKALVVRAESVTVPAGTFETLMITHTMYVNPVAGPAETAARTVWYSPNVKYFVRVHYERRRADGFVLESNVSELKSYSAIP